MARSKKRRNKAVTASQQSQPVRLQQSQTYIHPSLRTRLGWLCSGLIAGIGLAAAALGFYQFVQPTAQISILVPMPASCNTIGFRVYNSSSVNFFDVETTCYVHKLAGNGVAATENELKHNPGMDLKEIEAGTAKFATCAMQNIWDRPLLQGDIEMSIQFKVRCLPFLPICRHVIHKHFWYVGFTKNWIEGDVAWTP